MEEYIKRKSINSLLDLCLAHSNGAEHYAYSVVKRELDAEPSYEVAEVRHAYWKPMLRYPTEYVCSECGELWNNFHTPYCHECGAKMDKKGE